MPTINKGVHRPWLPKRVPHGRRLIDNSKVYNSTRWEKVRLLVLVDNPLCVMCAQKGITSAATDVDHVIPISHGGAIYDRDNLQGLCKTCHHSKSGAESSQRGRQRQRGRGGANP